MQRILYKHVCDKLNFNVCIVETSNEALELFLERSFKAVLMDWQMPGMSGLECTAKMREIESSTGRVPVPIIAVTANALVGDRETCLRAGMDDYLSKPFSMAQLDSTVKRWTTARAV